MFAHQTGIRCPHQSCLLMHQSRMFSSHMLYVLANRSGSILMLPSATACSAAQRSGHPACGAEVPKTGKECHE